MDIKLFELSTGEIILTQIKNEDDNYITWTKPIMIVAAPEGKIMLVPWGLAMLSKDNTISVNKKHIIGHTEASQDLYNAYNEKFGSGLTLPNTNLIT